MSVSLRSEVLTMVTLDRLGVYPPDQSSTTPVWALGASLVRLSEVLPTQALRLGVVGPRVAKQRSISLLVTQSSQSMRLQVQIFCIPRQYHHWLRSMQWKSRPPRALAQPRLQGRHAYSIWWGTSLP